ncbi:MAG TPA: hypothetical protein VHO84_06570 [Syntrophorhabdaceae bacterium]|nr:hypothetical protein [Syntrophorhabdaceae bacterium]
MENSVTNVRKDYLFTRATGIYNLRSAEQILANLIQRGQEHGLSKIVCDVRSVKGLEPSMPMIALHGISRMITRLLPGTTRLAVIGKSEKYGVAEDLMRKKGIQVLFTADYRKAIRWLRLARDIAATPALRNAGREDIFFIAAEY